MSAKKRKVNLPLLEVFVVSIVLHVGGLLAFGGFVLYQYVNPKDHTLDAPPPAERIQPQRLQRMVQLQQDTRESKRPPQRIEVQQVSEMSLANMNFQIPELELASNIAGADYGAGAARASIDSGGIDLSMPELEFMDIKVRGERFFFVLDASDYTLDDKYGGIPAYNLFKDELTREIEKLPAGALFNVLFYRGDNLQVFNPTGLVPATPDNKARLQSWITPINSTYDNRGLTSNTQMARRNYDRNFNEDAVKAWLQGIVVAAEQGSDTIFLITHGRDQKWPSWYFTKDRNEEQYAREQAEWEGSKEQEEWEAALAETRAAIDRENAARERAGRPKKVVNSMWSEVRQRFPDITFPPTPERQHYEESDVVGFIKSAFQELYLNNRERDYGPPSINVVQMIEQDTELDPALNTEGFPMLVRRFSGRYKAIEGMEALEDLTN